MYIVFILGELIQSDLDYEWKANMSSVYLKVVFNALFISLKQTN